MSSTREEEEPLLIPTLLPRIYRGHLRLWSWRGKLMIWTEGWQLLDAGSPRR